MRPSRRGKLVKRACTDLGAGESWRVSPGQTHADANRWSTFSLFLQCCFSFFSVRFISSLAAQFFRHHWQTPTDTMSGRGGGRGRGRGRGGDFGGGGGRGGGRGDFVRPVTEGTRIEIDVQLERFKASNDAEIVFPPDMSNHDRAVVHACCKKLGLKSKSHGKGDERRVCVTKPKEYKPLDHEDLHALSLHGASVSALQSHFSQFPQTKRELETAATGSLDDAWDEEPIDGGDDSRNKNKRSKRQGSSLMKPYTQISQNDALSRAKALADRRASDHNLKDMQRLRDALPIAEFKQTLLDAVENHQVVLVAGATGCGKTTQVPQYLIDHNWSRGKGAAVMCTQPRRISAITVSERIAAERGEAIGAGTVGYQIRLESKANADKCALLFCTNGVLLRRLTSPGADEMLKGLSHIVVDELHERDLFADFLGTCVLLSRIKHDCSQPLFECNTSSTTSYTTSNIYQN